MISLKKNLFVNLVIFLYLNSKQAVAAAYAKLHNITGLKAPNNAESAQKAGMEILNDFAHNVSPNVLLVKMPNHFVLLVIRIDISIKIKKLQ